MIRIKKICFLSVVAFFLSVPFCVPLHGLMSNENHNFSKAWISDMQKYPFFRTQIAALLFTGLGIVSDQFKDVPPFVSKTFFGLTYVSVAGGLGLIGKELLKDNVCHPRKFFKDSMPKSSSIPVHQACLLNGVDQKSKRLIGVEFCLPI